MLRPKRLFRNKRRYFDGAEKEEEKEKEGEGRRKNNVIKRDYLWRAFNVISFTPDALGIGLEFQGQTKWK